MIDKGSNFGPSDEVQLICWMAVDMWVPPVIATTHASFVRAHPVFESPRQTIGLIGLRGSMLVLLLGVQKFKSVMTSLEGTLCILWTAAQDSKGSAQQGCVRNGGELHSQMTLCNPLYNVVSRTQSCSVADMSRL
jgi:hypothetical protein